MNSEMDNVFKINMEKHLPLKEVVFRVLREAIIRGEIAPGSRLLEIQLSEKMGVSRTPIRDALRMLNEAGLVELIPRKGAVVSNITEKQMRDVLEVRVAMEELGVRLCTRRITESALLELEEAERNFEDSIDAGDVNRSASLDERFHTIISEATGNKSLVMMLTSFREQMYRFRVAYLMREDVHGVLVEEHRELIRCFRKGDEDGAVRTLRRHIDGQQAMVLDMAISEKNIKQESGDNND